MSASPYASRQEQVFLLHAARVIYTDASQLRILQDHSRTTAKETEAQPPVAVDLDRGAVTIAEGSTMQRSESLGVLSMADRSMADRVDMIHVDAALGRECCLTATVSL